MDGQVRQNPSYDDKPGVIVVADGPDACRSGAEPAELVGARIIAHLGWAALAAGGLDAHSVPKLLHLEAIGVSDAVLDEALPVADAFARHLDIPVVASIADTQIDLAARHLFGRHVQLLVAPSPTDRVAALAIAGSLQLDSLTNEARDAEAVRLRRLNEEVARIAETLARLTRGEALMPDRPGMAVEDRRTGYGAPPGADTAPVTPIEVRQAIRSRRLRSQFFDDGLFEDPAWDMLLDLFAAELERAQVSVSSLCIAAAVAPTTALRWIAKMTETGLLLRHPDPFDRRRAYMALSERARGGMRDYCAAVRRAGLSIA